MASTAATIAKEQGNASFKRGNFADAVGHYSAAVVADRSEPTYPLNRAAAYLKLGKHRDAERDCTTVLSLDGKNVKALFRRSQARVALRELAEAEQDLTDALRLDSANAFFKQELAAVQTQRLEFAKKQASSKREPITVPPVSSIQSQTEPAPLPHARRIVRNVPIEIIEPDEPESSKGFLKLIQSRALSPSTASPHPASSAATEPSSQPKLQPRVGAGIFRADGSHAILRAPDSSTVPATARSSPPTTNSRSSPPSAPPPPLTHFAFSRAWHALPTAEERYNLLHCVSPASLPTLFQNSLEPAFLVSILRTFESITSPATSSDVAAYMTAFPAVPRFDTVVLFLSSQEKDIVRRVWGKLGDEQKDAKSPWGIYC